ncbi:MAG: hypothetical protein JSR80_03050 [Verrucomicrobia bacterium]|nr:hypothetical protein [Verrucomicrobiota bacterium]
MKQGISQSIALLKIANFIVIVGSGITWTGLSYDLAARYDDPRFMGLMQMLSVIASFFGPFIALWLNSRCLVRSIVIFSEFVAALSCIAIFLVLTPVNFGYQMIFPILIFVLVILLAGSISGLFIEPLYANLIEKRDGSDQNVRREFANFASFGILGKLCGMSLGPLVFASFDYYSLLLNAASFLLSFFLCWAAMNRVPSDMRLISIRPEQVTIFKKSTWAEVFKLPLIETAMSNSMIFVVVLAMSTKAIVLQASTLQMSLFWFGATGCAFFAHFSLSRFIKISDFFFSLERRYGFLQAIPIAIGLFAKEMVWLLIAQWLFSLLNPLTTNQSRTDFYRIYGRDSNNALDAYAMRNILSNVIIIAFSLVVALVDSSVSSVLLPCTLISLVFLRWAIALRVRLQGGYSHG